MRGTRFVAHIVMLVVLLLVAAPSAFAGNGGMEYTSAKERRAKQTKKFKQRTAKPKAVLLPNGLAAAPVGAPPEVQSAIEAANRIIGKPYKYGGGHAKVEDSGYDCSGSVSYALLGGELLDAPLDSGSFMSWGKKGKGKWITVYTNPGHAFAVIAGLRLDTSAAGDPGGLKGPRWRPNLRSKRGFVARHPKGF